MKVGILGGSGLYALDALTGVTEKILETPFGPPSDAYVGGRIGENEVFFLPRHGRGHRLLPSEINHRANIFGFKMLGVERVLSVSAVGSLKEALRPRDIVLPDQYFDRTKKAMEHTFFGGGIVAHISFADPACGELRDSVAEVARRVVACRKQEGNLRVHVGGTYVNMEGPAFSTRSEAAFHRAFGFDVIGMTSLAEAKLCREAEMCYQAISMVTDYDCWHETEEAVSVDLLIENLKANTELAQEIILEIVPSLKPAASCSCGQTLSRAILTRLDAAPKEAIRRLAPIIGRYV